MCVYIYIYIYIYTYISIYTHRDTYSIHIDTYTYNHIYTCLYVYGSLLRPHATASCSSAGCSLETPLNQDRPIKSQLNRN